MTPPDLHRARLWGCALSLAALTACFPKPGVAPGPLDQTALASAQQRWDDASPESLERGRQLYLGACNDCHQYPDLVHYPEERWPRIAERMGRKAELSPEEIELVERFILAARSQQASAAAASR